MPVITSANNIDLNAMNPDSPPSLNHGLLAALYSATATPSARLWLCGAVLLASAALLSCLSFLRRSSRTREEEPLSKSTSTSRFPYFYRRLARSGISMAEARREEPRAESPADEVLGFTDKKESSPGTAAAHVRSPSSTAARMTRKLGPSLGNDAGDDDEAGIGTGTGAGASPEAPPRRRSYTKMVDGVGVDVQEEIVVAEGWKRHTRVYGGGVCQACLESEQNRGRMA